LYLGSAKKSINPMHITSTEVFPPKAFKDDPEDLNQMPRLSDWRVIITMVNGEVFKITGKEAELFAEEQLKKTSHFLVESKPPTEAFIFPKG
jgi:hypothetical protein